MKKKTRKLMRQGVRALTRIADALERAYPRPPDMTACEVEITHDGKTVVVPMMIGPAELDNVLVRPGRQMLIDPGPDFGGPQWGTVKLPDDGEAT